MSFTNLEFNTYANELISEGKILMSNYFLSFSAF